MAGLALTTMFSLSGSTSQETMVEKPNNDINHSKSLDTDNKNDYRRNQENIHDFDNIKEEQGKQEDQLARQEVDEKTLTSANQAFVLPAGVKYSEIAGGSGEIGYVDKNIAVKPYSRAMVELDPITGDVVDWKHLPGIGVSWEVYCEQQGITMEQLTKEYQDNPNLQEYVCLQQLDKELDIENTYGWATPDQLIDRERLYQQLDDYKDMKDQYFTGNKQSQQLHDNAEKMENGLER